MEASTITEELGTTLEWVRSFAQDTAGPFMAEQTPLFIEEMLRWAIVSNTAIGLPLLLVCVILTIVGVFCVYRSLTVQEDNLKKLDWGIEGAALLAVSFLMSIPTAHCLGTAGKAYFAPRVYVVEQLSQYLP